MADTCFALEPIVTEQATVDDLAPRQLVVVRGRPAIITQLDFPLVYWRHLTEAATLRLLDPAASFDVLTAKDFRDKLSEGALSVLLEPAELHRVYSAVGAAIRIRAADRPSAERPSQKRKGRKAKRAGGGVSGSVTGSYMGSAHGLSDGEGSENVPVADMMPEPESDDSNDIFAAAAMARVEADGYGGDPEGLQRSDDGFGLAPPPLNGSKSGSSRHGSVHGSLQGGSVHGGSVHGSRNGRSRNGGSRHGGGDGGVGIGLSGSESNGDEEDEDDHHVGLGMGHPQMGGSLPGSDDDEDESEDFEPDFDAQFDRTPPDSTSDNEGMGRDTGGDLQYGHSPERDGFGRSPHLGGAGGALPPPPLSDDDLEWEAHFD